MTALTSPSFTAFDGWKRIATGTLEAIALEVKRAAQSGAIGPLLIFDDQTGSVQDVDIRGTDAETLARLPKPSADDGTGESNSADGAATAPPRGRGRPKLGVTAREVTLLPRHWSWLAAQPGGASVALRKLVEEASRVTSTRDRMRSAQERSYQFMSTMAGNMPGFEESTRALFAGDANKFRDLTEGWPGDVRDYARQLASLPET